MKLNPINLKAALARSRRREEADPGFHAGTPPPHVVGYGGGERGVALVITLLMLAVITFMTVTFLTLSTREKGAVTTATDQTVARLAADSALERAKAELLAGILSTKNAANFGLMVSTNFVNLGGFDPGAYDQRTNVNYDYRQGGGLLNAADRLQNLANLLYDPRVPVAVTNRLLGSNEFRFFINLNRNVRSGTNVFDPTGVQPMLDNAGNLVPLFPGPGFASNYYVGDPQWIGGLERPDLTHSSTNKFLYRYAFITVPTGKTLDVNYSYNQALRPDKALLSPFGRDYFRNQGVGTWELNLASFFYDLNTNMYAGGGQYTSFLNPNSGVITWGGNPFVDALDFYRYRLNGPRKDPLYQYNAADAVYRTTLNNVANLYGGPGVNAFTTDFFDGYSAGPLVMTSGKPFVTDPDVGRVSSAWPGADNPYHFFTTQEFFDPAKTSVPFVRQLSSVSTSNSSYDQNTFYRMLEELGTDSAPEDPGKLNLNYKNTGGFAATNFVAWTPEDFFTNAADKLLKQYTAEWLGANLEAYTNSFGTNRAFGVADIPVYIGSNFVYRASVHRLLQLAANLVDATTNRAAALGADFPSVFKPVFQRDVNNNVFIAGYRQVDTVSGTADPRFSIPLDLSNSSQAALVQPDDNIYGVPWVIAAKKGWPNFNEVAMESVFEVTRKLEITRSRASAQADTRPQDDPTAKTNMLFLLGVSSTLGVEAWNSYATNYNRPVQIVAAADFSMVLTNSYGYRLSLPPNSGVVVVTNLAAGSWPANNNQPNNNPSVIVPLLTNITLLPISAYQFPPNVAGFTTNWASAWQVVQDNQPGLQAQWGLLVTNRLRFIMLDTLTGRVIDYVQLNNLTGMTNLSEVIRDGDLARGYDGLWSTNPVAGSSIPRGIYNQIIVSMGAAGGVQVDRDKWRNSSKIPYTDQVQLEIDKFAALYKKGTAYGAGLKNTNEVVQVPFTPTKKYYQYLTWQVNDPLVHYTVGDLTDLARPGDIWYPLLPPTTNTPPVSTLGLGRLNDRYQPWGGNPGQATDPDKYNPALKDPLMRSSDDWNFPTNKYPNLGWLGRVHRGSPWQTVYMKAGGVDGAKWQKWTGNGDPNDAARAQPASDRSLFDLFTTAINENAARGQLPINQSGLAAWSAVFGGLVALTNSSTEAQLNGVGNGGIPLVRFDPLLIQPAGAYDAANTNAWPALVKLVEGINRERANTNNHPSQTFTRLGDIVSVPELTEKSPFLNTNSAAALQLGLNDQAYEWLPQQVISLLRVGEPRFVIYSYGQALRPADNSVYTAGGAFFGMVTNYEIAAEVATRAVVRVEGSPVPGGPGYPPHIVVESFNQLPPD